jgi:4,5-dihydroxyphthalate decarboxylase
VTTVATTLELSAALGENPRTRPILDGEVAPEGIRLLLSALHGSEMFWRQLKFAEFDVSELSLSSLIIATSHEPTPWVAIPIFTTRMFMHTGILVRAAAGITKPIELHGKRVGVPEYQQTSALWSRGILMDQFGVDPREISWVMERPPQQSHGGTMGFQPPPGVKMEYMSPDTNIGELMVAGKLDATLLYLNTPNLVDRSRIDLDTRADIKPLFPDPAAEAYRYFAATGFIPINHTLVVRRSLLEQHPWIARSLYDAFVAAKNRINTERDAVLAPWFDTGLLGAHAKSGLARDPLAYGVQGARAVLETIARYTYEQGLAKRLVALDEIFASSTMEL